MTQTFEFLTGRTLFRAQGGSNWKAEDDLLANQLELLSLKQFPSYFNQNSRYALYHLKEDGKLIDHLIAEATRPADLVEP